MNQLKLHQGFQVRDRSFLGGGLWWDWSEQSGYMVAHRTWCNCPRMSLTVGQSWFVQGSYYTQVWLWKADFKKVSSR